MKDNDSILPNDGQKDTLRRYERSLSEGRAEYFGTDELEVVVDYYIQRLKFQKLLQKHFQLENFQLMITMK